MLGSKVNNKENICYVQETDFHKMHIAIRPITKAFEKLQESFTRTNDDIIKLKMPLENYKFAKIGRALQYATAKHCPY